ncbi:MAG: hypothetical protein ABI433_13310 [Burkholderiaceae bacterium]
MKNQEIDAPVSVLRRKLLLGLPSGFALASPLAMLGCGGGGDDDSAQGDSGPMAQAPATEREALAVQVALPSGVAATGLVVGSGTSLARVTASGASGVVLLDAGSSLAYLLTDSGALLGMGLVGKDRPTIDSRTTAEALIYLGCSPSQLGEAWQFALRKVLASHAVVLPVVAAVEAAMRRGSVDVTDTALRDAVLNAVASIRGRSGMAISGAANDSRVKRLALSYDNGVHSGMKVVEQPGFNTIALENSFRRRAVATVERFGHTSADGSIVLETPSKVGEFTVDPTDALNLSNAVNAVFEKTLEDLLVALNLIGDYDLGNLPWTAKTSEPFELPLVPADAREIYYRVNVVGLGAQPASRELTGAELDTYERLLITTLIKDLILPVASAFLLPIAGTFAAKALSGKNSALLGLAMGLEVTKGAFAMELFPVTVAALRAGHWGEALIAVGTELLGTDVGKKLVSDTLSNLIHWSAGPALATIRDAAGNILAVDLLSTEGQRLTRNFISGLEKITGWVAVVEEAMLIADVGAQAHDITASRMLDDFRVDASPSVVEVTPASVTLSLAGGSQRFEVSSVDGQAPQQGWFYEWSCASKSGFIVVGAQTSSEAAPTLLQAPDPSTLYTVKGGNTGDEIEGITVRVFNSKRQYMGRNTVQVIIEHVVQGTLTPPSVEFERGGSNAQQLFTLTLDPAPADATQLKYEWICPSQHGTLQSGGVTTSIDTPRVTSGQPNATYRLAAGSTGGERENISVEVFQRAVDSSSGAETWKKISTAQATAKVKAEFSLGISPPGPSDVPTDTSMTLSAFFNETLPAAATVTWEWSHAGAGALEAVPADNNPADSAVTFKTTAAEGAATVTATATVTIPATGTTATRVVEVPLVSTTLNVKKGLKTITMEVSGGVFGCTDPLACGVSEYTAFIVPRLAKAVSYSAVLSGYAYPSCNRTVTWNSVKGDGGGCNFPVTYFPHSSAGATNAWAVWIGFGGPISGKCVVTITLAP